MAEVRYKRSPVGSMLDQETVDKLTREAFAEHSGCRCTDAGHALAIAGHKIIEAEYYASEKRADTPALRLAAVDRIWNGRTAKARRTCHSALWRALWSARNQKLIVLALPMLGNLDKYAEADRFERVFAGRKVQA
jgi:hypothetical protein